MKKVFVFAIVAMVFGFAACSISGINPSNRTVIEDDGTMGEYGSLIVNVNGVSKDGIGFNEFPVTATFSVSNATQGNLHEETWYSNWQGSFQYRDLKFGINTLRLFSIDTNNNLSTFITNIDLRAGFNYTLWVWVGGNIFSYVVSTN